MSTIQTVNLQLVSAAVAIAEGPIATNNYTAYNRFCLPILSVAHGEYKKNFVHLVLRTVGVLPATFSLMKFDIVEMMQAI